MNSPVSRRGFLEQAAVIAAANAVLARSNHQGVCAAENTAAATSVPTNIAGAYGSWLSDSVLTEVPGTLSLRSGRWSNPDEWRIAARKRLWDCLAPVDLGGVPEVRVDARTTFDGLQIERVSWQLPCGPRTEAVIMKPENATGKMPAVLALHDHGGNKFLGWRKVARFDSQMWEVQAKHHIDNYGGMAWANEVAKRGYVVLAHDTFPFASRRIKVADVIPLVRGEGVDPEPDDLEGISKYNRFAAMHEHSLEKSLLCAGTTWPGVYVKEDQKALDVLCARPDVDATRVGCGGLSGGGMRTVYLAGLDDRIRCAIAMGFMTTWRDFILNKSANHTWMAYTPLIAKDLDFPEILGLRAPAATMVQNCNEDLLYTLSEMQRADQQLSEVFKRAGKPENYRGKFYPGRHRFDQPMQADAFQWFDQHLKS